MEEAGVQQLLQEADHTHIHQLSHIISLGLQPTTDMTEFEVAWCEKASGSCFMYLGLQPTGDMT